MFNGSGEKQHCYYVTRESSIIRSDQKAEGNLHMIFYLLATCSARVHAFLSQALDHLLIAHLFTLGTFQLIIHNKCIS